MRRNEVKHCNICNGEDETNPADYLSRYSPTQPLRDNDGENYMRYVTKTATPNALTLEEIRLATSRDVQLQAVMTAITTGNWSAKSLLCFKTLKDELSVHDGIVLRQHRILVPEILQNQVISNITLAHASHQGIVKTKQLICENVWFLGIDRMVEEHLKNCLPCQAAATLPNNVILFKCHHYLKAGFVLSIKEWTLTLHTQPETWNDATIACREREGRLVELTDERRRTAFNSFLSRPTWAKHIDSSVLVGLAWDSNRDSFQWIGCGEAPTELSPDDGYCGAWAKNWSQPFAVSCFDQPMKFICQAAIDRADCSIEIYHGKVPYASEEVMTMQPAGTDTLGKCYNNCKKEGYDCLAFSFSNASETDIYRGPHFVKYSRALTPFPWPCEGNDSGKADKNINIYIFYQSPLSWAEAKSKCESIGYRLAEFDSLEKQLMWTPAEIKNTYWSGFRRHGPDLFKWMRSNVVVSPAPEDETDDAGADHGSGGGSCGATVLPEMVNKMINCEKQLPFMCQEKKENVTDLLLTTQTSHPELTTSDSVATMMSPITTPSDNGDENPDAATTHESRMETGKTTQGHSFEFSEEGSVLFPAPTATTHATSEFADDGNPTNGDENNTNERAAIVTQPNVDGRTSDSSSLHFDVDETTDHLSTGDNNLQHNRDISLSNTVQTFNTETSTTDLSLEETSHKTSGIESSSLFNMIMESLTTVGTGTQENTMPSSTVDSTSFATLPEEFVSDGSGMGLLDTSTSSNTEVGTSENSPIETDVTTGACGQCITQGTVQSNTDLSPISDTSHQQSTVPVFMSTSLSNVWHSSNLAGFSLCRCSCSNITRNINMREENFTKVLDGLEEFAYNTGLATRRKESAPDSRPSSTSIGLVATLLMAAIFFTIFCSDIYHLFQ
ncbi:hypothetical protein EGW08_015532 [Elysia chlorotica]|uniref:C-type lectin domain-containing protein n=1 Tax=Elysia chlorotica TaxID=188477 RepID=A0A3S0ZW47_ELYCH|nr:hypothetical protein EGW08_015532 [Elysia chlorotica]